MITPHLFSIPWTLRTLGVLLGIALVLAASGCEEDEAKVKESSGELPDSAYAGLPDLYFSSDGLATMDVATNTTGPDVGEAVVIQPNGKILVAGYTLNSTTGDNLLVARFNLNGSPDTSFGTGGRAELDYNSGQDRGHGIALLPNGQFLVAGEVFRSASGNQDMALWKFNANGTIDGTFPGAGIVTHNNAGGGNGIDIGWAVATDSLGRIVVAGESRGTTDTEAVVWRFDTGGNLDTASFNSSLGYRVYNAGSLDDVFYSLVITANDSIVTGGVTRSTNDVPVLFGLTNAGTPDTAFNGTGTRLLPNAVGGILDEIYSLTKGAGGKILAAGYANTGIGTPSAVVWRLTSTGTDDITFGAGSARTVIQGAAYRVRSVLEDSVGRVYLVGEGPGQDLYIWRLRADGSLDPDYAQGFGYIASGLTGNDYGRAARIDATGKLVVAGMATNSNGDLAVWRFLK